MTPISPTALEAAAKAVFEQSIYHGYNDEVKAREWTRTSDLHRNAATAAITAYLAQMEKEGFVMVRGVSTCNIESLRPIESDLLNRLMQGVNIASSDRASCGARTRLKKLGLIAFNREPWRWVITDTGRAMLAAAQNGEDLPAPPMGK